MAEISNQLTAYTRCLYEADVPRNLTGYMPTPKACSRDVWLRYLTS